MNWIEQAIAVVAPGYAAKRVAQQLRLNYLTEMAEKFSFDAVQQKRRMGKWNAPGTDVNAANATGLYQLRNMASDLVRNSPYARQALAQLVGHQIGTGAKLIADTGDIELNAIIDREWNAWCEQCDADGQHNFDGLQWTVARAVPERGEVLVRFRTRRRSDGLRVPLQLQVLEGDFLDHQKTQQLKDGYIIQGVEFDQIGRRRGYWLYGSHPGAFLQMNRRGGWESSLVSSDSVAHVYLKERGGVRGITWFASVLASFRELQSYEEAIWMRKRLESCIGLIINRTEIGLDAAVGSIEQNTETNKIEESLEPGMIVHAHPGQKIEGFDPKPAPDHTEFRTAKLHEIAAGLEMPYEILTGDYSKTTYSSYKAGQLSFRHIINQYRWLSYYPMFLVPVRRRWLEMAYLTGVIPALHYGTQVTFPTFESVEPLKDIESTLKRVRAGFQAYPDAVAEYGFDPNQVVKQISEWNKKLDAAGIISDADPRQDVERIKALSAPVGGA